MGALYNILYNQAVLTVSDLVVVRLLQNPFDIRSFTGLLLPSRGLLPVNFLTGTATASEYMEDLQSQEFPGYNLFVADLAQQPPELYYYCNRNQQPPQQLDPGLHGIANATIDADWPKVLRGRQRFQQLVDQGKLGGTELPWEDIFGIMRESELLEEDADKLPKTGYGPEFEMKASSIFVAPFETRWGPYGTRSQTVIAVRRNGVAELRERYLEDGKWLELRHTFTMNGTEGKESYDAEK